jgi:hypothetical protein
LVRFPVFDQEPDQRNSGVNLPSPCGFVGPGGGEADSAGLANKRQTVRNSAGIIKLRRDGKDSGAFIPLIGHGKTGRFSDLQKFYEPLTTPRALVYTH